MKMITGLIETKAGNIFFDGQSIRSDLFGFKRRMGHVPEEPHLYSHLSGLEYLIMVGQLRGLPASPTADRIDALLRLLSLHSHRHARISSYSKGMQQKVLLSAALLHNPDLILLDEPFSGLDISTSLVLRGLIQESAARGKVVLFSSHESETVEQHDGGQKVKGWSADTDGSDANASIWGDNSGRGKMKICVQREGWSAGCTDDC
jgi:ABC-2 type transport system ATP-binding protein